MKKFTFGKDKRIRAEKDFKRVIKEGKSYANHYIVMYVLDKDSNGDSPSELPPPRFGLSVDRRVGKATVRNRVKRLLREVCRLKQHSLKKGLEIVLIARAPARELLRYTQMETRVLNLWKKAQILQE